MTPKPEFQPGANLTLVKKWLEKKTAGGYYGRITLDLQNGAITRVICEESKVPSTLAREVNS